MVSIAVVLHQSGFPQILHGRFFETRLYPAVVITSSSLVLTFRPPPVSLIDAGKVSGGHHTMTTKAKGRSFRQRLLNVSLELSLPYQNLETAVMLERLVARLIADEFLHRHLVFKGDRWA